MKRPLAAVGMSFLLTLAVFCCLAGAALRLTAALALLAGLAASLRVRGEKRQQVRTLRLVLSAGCAAALFFFAQDGLQRSTAAYLARETRVCELTVTAVRPAPGGADVTARLDRADGRRILRTEVRFFAPSADLETAARLRAVCAFTPDGAQYGEKLSLRAAAVEVGAVLPQDRLLALGRDIRRSMLGAAQQYLSGESAQLVEAVVTGDKTRLSDALRVDFARAGIGHILVVSGLHVSFLLLTLYGLGKKLGLGEKACFFLCAGASGPVFLVYGVGASVVRAVVMCLFVLYARLRHRRSDPLTAMAAAALLLLVPSPKTAGEISFQLSFGCCFAICAVYPALCGRLRRRSGRRKLPQLLRKAAEPLLLTLCVLLVTLPILVLHGLSLSLVSPLTNLLIVPLVGPLLAGAILLWLFASLPFLAGAAAAAGFFCALLAKTVLVLAKWSASFAFAAIDTSALWLRAAVLALVLLTAARALCGGRLRLRLIAAVTCGVLLLGLGAKAVLLHGSVAVAVYSESAVAVCADGRLAVVLGDTDAREVRYLDSWLRCRFLRRPGYVIMRSAPDAETRAAVQAMLAPDGQCVTWQPEPQKTEFVFPEYTLALTRQGTLLVGRGWQVIALYDSGGAPAAEYFATGRTRAQLALRGDAPQFLYIRSDGRVTAAEE